MTREEKYKKAAELIRSWMESGDDAYDYAVMMVLNSEESDSEKRVRRILMRICQQSYLPVMNEFVTPSCDVMFLLAERIRLTRLLSETGAVE